MAVFTWKCDMSDVKEGIQFNNLITEFESGKEQRRVKGAPRRTWKLRFKKDQVDADEIWDFYVARKGTFEPFEWTSPIDGKTYTVRFAQDNLQRSVLWKVLYDFGLDLIEVI